MSLRVSLIFSGRFEWMSGLVHSAVWLPAAVRPATLVDPQ